MNFHLWSPMLIVYCVLLVLTCLIGDHLPRMNHVGPYINRHLLLRVAIDNFTHGIIGFLSWAIVLDLDLLDTDSNTPPVMFHPSSGFVPTRSLMDAQQRNLLACLFCMLLAMSVDVDHFLAARSFSLQDALSLPSRPPFHCTTLIPVVVASSLLMTYAFHSRQFCRCFKFSLLFLTACLSHHIRDARRHGLWLWPFGATPPLPYMVYILCTLLLPVAVKFCHNSLFIENQPTHQGSVQIL
ncbi:Hypothetical predicted protein [Octopus vulgaris]|uniref:Transmembrane protein 267 n=1 Tax=Octopus vulgaris TaxID=6645 RepID=A0AA36FQZ4_OCTVU|nr:Hypothetical predicted protein [Octopus vulgaris]